jgi:hypothetical protein
VPDGPLTPLGGRSLSPEVTGGYQRLLNQYETGRWTPVIQGDWHAPFRPTLFPFSLTAHYLPPPEGFTLNVRPPPPEGEGRQVCGFG